MKIAVLVCGHVRTYRQCYVSLFEHLIRHHEADIYLSMWDTVSSKDANNPVGADTKIDLGDIWARYSPAGVIVESNRTFNTPYDLTSSVRNFETRKRPETRVSATFSAAHRVLAADKLRYDSWRTYDLVVRTRFDLLFQSPVELFCPGATQVVLPDYKPHRDWDVVRGQPGVNTNFAFGGPWAMSRYCSIYRHIGRLWDEGAMFHPETLLAAHLKAQELEVLRTPMKYIFARDPGYEDQTD